MGPTGLVQPGSSGTSRAALARRWVRNCAVASVRCVARARATAKPRVRFANP